MKTYSFLPFFLVLLLAACGSSSDGKIDAGPDASIDAGSDAGEDAGLDAGEDAGLDAGADAGGDSITEVPLEGWGTITGQCGELDDDEWTSTSPFDFTNHIDFGTVGFVYEDLSPGGQTIFDDDNLGGSSIHSEIIAYETLYRCELAELLKTERFIEYLDVNGKKTDILVRIDERKVGVSVVRAFHYPPTEPYPLEDAVTKLRQKLSEVLLSAANADPADAWERSMLHVVAYNDQSADAFAVALDQLEADEPEVVDETIVLITVTDGEDAFAYE